MDWRSWVVIEKRIDDEYWNDIIKSRSIEGGFYNIKIFKKEDRFMQAYLEFLAELQNEMNTIQSANIEEIVDRRVAEFRERVRAEELEKQASEKSAKQAEIDAVNRIIDRLRVKAEAENAEQNQNMEEI